VSGTDIRIVGEEATSQGQIRNGVIVDAEGEKWIRAGATDDPLDSITWMPAILKRPDFPWELLDIAAVLLIFILLIFTRS
jgi:hypothetical protein